MKITSESLKIITKSTPNQVEIRFKSRFDLLVGVNFFQAGASENLGVESFGSRLERPRAEKEVDNVSFVRLEPVQLDGRNRADV